MVESNLKRDYLRPEETADLTTLQETVITQQEGKQKWYKFEM